MNTSGSEFPFRYLYPASDGSFGSDSGWMMCEIYQNKDDKIPGCDGDYDAWDDMFNWPTDEPIVVSSMHQVFDPSAIADACKAWAKAFGDDDTTQEIQPKDRCKRCGTKLVEAELFSSRYMRCPKCEP